MEDGSLNVFGKDSRVIDLLIRWRVCMFMLKTENGKYCSKIIFKCVNSIVRPNFEVVLLKKSTFHEQCTGSIEKGER